MIQQQKKQVQNCKDFITILPGFFNPKKFSIFFLLNQSKGVDVSDELCQVQLPIVIHVPNGFEVVFSYSQIGNLQNVKKIWIFNGLYNWQSNSWNKIYTDFLIYFSFERRGFAYILHKEDILKNEFLHYCKL